MEDARQYEQLRASEHLFRVFFENAQGLMCMHNLQGKLLLVNSASAASLGYTAAELSEKTLWDIVPTAHHSAIRQYLNAISANGKLTGTMHVLHRNGSARIWLFNNVLETTTGGERFVIGNALDITERHTLEADLRFTKQMLEQTNEVARIGGWQYDLLQEKIYWSRETRNIHEVPEGFEPSLVDGLSFYAPADRLRITAALEKATENGTPWDLELQLITATGREIWVRSIGSAEFRNGSSIRLYGTFQDIDERKRLEIEGQRTRKQLENVLNASSEVAMIATDLEGVITVFNRGAEKMVGYNAAEMVGRQTPAILHDTHEVEQRGAELSLAYNRAIRGFMVFVHLATLKGAEQREWTYIRKDGSRITVSLVVTPVRDLDDSIIGYLGVAIDISDRKKAEAQINDQRIRLSNFVRELRHAKKLAEQGSIAKSEFLANMSHEIRTPLNGIIGFTDLLLKTTLTDVQHQYITLVYQSAGILLNIINDILDFSKIEAGKLELDVTKIDLYETTNQVSDLVKFQAQSKGLEMLYNISLQLPRFVWADQLRIKQVLVNLLSNAVKFTEQGEVELRVTPLSALAGGAIDIRFEVRDTGIGIRPDRRQKIFEAFSQEDTSVTKKYGGTGLGLTISNKLLALMNSRLQVTSEWGAGSVFFFDVRLNAEAGAAILWEGLEKIKTALIVDDNDNNRTIIQEILQLKQIDSTQAKNGFEALQHLAAGERYDVVLIDYHMPVIDGLETIRKIRERTPAGEPLQPVVLLHSSSDDEKVIRTCEALQVSQRLIKPIKMQDLYHALTRLHRKGEMNDSAPQTPQALPARHEELRILLVEDNKVNLLLARVILSRIAAQAIIAEANNGEEAVRQFKEHRPDIVLMDIQMPVMDGYDAAKAIREYETANGGHIPIIALTAGNVIGEKERCLAAGMDDFVAKPFVEETLAALFDKWLEKNERIAPLDLSVLKNFLGGPDVKESTVRQALKLSFDECRQIQTELQSQSGTDDWGQLRGMGHRLYGVAAYSGLTNLAAVSREIENATTQEQASSLRQRLLVELQQAIAIYEITLQRLTHSPW